MTLATFVPKTSKWTAPEDASGIRQQIVDAVNAIQDSHPRTLQRALGPSEVGEPCARQIAYKLIGHREVEYRVADPMPSFLGIGAHARMQEALELWNQSHPGTWVAERRLTIPGVLDGGAGTSDALHVPTKTTVDWKFLGDTTFRALQTNGPGRKYRAQGHIYGLGWTVAGFQVERVAIGVFGRSKPLSAMFVWSEPFDPAYAVAELQRVANIRTVVTWLQQKNSDVSIVPATPGSGCYYCPFRGEPAQGFCEGLS